MEIVVILLLILLIAFLVVRAQRGAKRRQEMVLSDVGVLFSMIPITSTEGGMKRNSEKTISD